MTGLSEAIRRSATQHKDKVAVIAGERVLTYRELLRDWDACIATLASADIGSGTRLMVQGTSHWDMFVIALACMDLEAILVPNRPGVGAAWIDTLCGATGAAAILTSRHEVTRLERSVDVLSVPPDVHALIMTSGTTGDPKGVPIHRAMTDAAARNAIELLHLRAKTVFLNFIPPASVGGLFLAGLPLLAVGATQIVSAFNPFEFAAMIDLHKPTHTILLPVMINVLKNLAGWQSLDLSCFETLLSGAAPVSESAAQAVLDRGVRRFVHAYGSSECLTPVIAHESFSPTDMGKTILSRFSGDYVHHLSVDGELMLRGTAVMRGYYGLRSIPTACGNGWFQTGDVFSEEASGLRFVGRADERLKINGFSVVPEVTERAIAEIPGVTNCAVVKSVGRSGAEALVALVAGPANSADILRVCRLQLDAPQVPRRVMRVPQVPINGMGKIDRGSARRLLTSAEP